jgi:hypothetical protein
MQGKADAGITTRYVVIAVPAIECNLAVIQPGQTVWFEPG